MAGQGEKRCLQAHLLLQASAKQCPAASRAQKLGGWPHCMSSPPSSGPDTIGWPCPSFVTVPFITEGICPPDVTVTPFSEIVSEL